MNTQVNKNVKYTSTQVTRTYKFLDKKNTLNISHEIIGVLPSGAAVSFSSVGNVVTDKIVECFDI